MKSKFVPWISFKFWLVVALGNTPGGIFLIIEENAFYFFCFLFFVFVNMRPHASNKFKTILLLYIGAESFHKAFLNVLLNGISRLEFLKC